MLEGVGEHSRLWRHVLGEEPWSVKLVFRCPFGGLGRFFIVLVSWARSCGALLYIYIYLNLENLHNRDSAVGKLFSHTAGSILPIATAWVMS